jgi:broad specificity phosphatase PhoE
MALGVMVLGAVMVSATVGLLRDCASLSGCHDAAGSDFERALRIPSLPVLADRTRHSGATVSGSHRLPEQRRSGKFLPHGASMMRRLAVLSAAPTAAQRRGEFAVDEGVEVGALDDVDAPAILAGDECRHGPERRCADTAHALGLESTPLSALRAWDLGSWAGRAINDIGDAEPEALGAWRQDPAAAPHGGETLANLLARVGAWLDEPSELRRVVAVADASVVRASVIHALGADWRAFWRLDLPPLSMSVVTHGSGNWRVRCVGAPLR